MDKDLVICKADKGNAIVVLDKCEYISKMKLILNSKQFSRTNKCLLKEKEVEMNKLIRELENNKIIDQKLFWKLHST